MVQYLDTFVPSEAFQAQYCQCNLETVKGNDGANEATFLELHHVIKYVLDMIHLGLKIYRWERTVGHCGTLSVLATVIMEVTW